MVKKKSKKEEKSFLKKRIKLRKILKPSQMTMIIKKVEQEPYKPIYFKQELEETKRSLFFD